MAESDTLFLHRRGLCSKKEKEGTPKASPLVDFRRGDAYSELELKSNLQLRIVS